MEPDVIMKTAIVFYGGKYLPKYLYKYRYWNDFTHGLLETGDFFLPSRKKFNDPFDCDFHIPYEDGSELERTAYVVRAMSQDFGITRPDDLAIEATVSLNNMPDTRDERREHARASFFQSMDRYGIYCLSSVCTDILMWSHYADYHKGICIGFDTVKLLESVESQLDTKFFMDYIRYSHQAPRINPYDFAREESQYLQEISLLFLTKYKTWEYESEFRICCDGFADVSITIDTACIAEIIFGINTPDETINKVRSICKGRDIAFYKAEKLEWQYGVKIQPL